MLISNGFLFRDISLAVAAGILRHSRVAGAFSRPVMLSENIQFLS